LVTDLFDITGENEVVLRLHVQPGAGRSAVAGRHGNALKVRVAAPPVEGRANAACLALVASTLGVKEGDLELVGGASSRQKRVKVTGVEPDQVERLLEAALRSGNTGPSRGVEGRR
jgi:uncharacterized protein (TIGR00251 family)